MPRYEPRLPDRQTGRSGVAPNPCGTTTNRVPVPSRRREVDRKRSLDASVHRFLSIQEVCSGVNVFSTYGSSIDAGSARGASRKAASNSSSLLSSKTLINTFTKNHDDRRTLAEGITSHTDEGRERSHVEHWHRCCNQCRNQQGTPSPPGPT